MRSSLAEDPVDVALIVDKLRAQMRTLVALYPAMILQEAEDRESVAKIIELWDLEREIRNHEVAMAVAHPGWRTGPFGSEGISALEEKIAGLNSEIRWPSPRSKDSALVSELKMVEVAVPLAIEQRLRRLQGQQGRESWGTVTEFELEQKLGELKQLNDQLNALLGAEKRGDGRVPNTVYYEVGDVSRKIGERFEDFLFSLTRVEPSLMDKMLAAVMSSGWDFAIAAGGILIAGLDPKNLAAWVGLTGLGLAVKVAEGLFHTDWRMMIPVWGGQIRGERLLDGWAKQGRLVSQAVFRRRAEIRAQFSNGDWRMLDTVFKDECLESLRKVALGLDNPSR